MMNLIIAVIQPSKLDDVKDALVKIGLQGMTVTGVKGFGRQKGRPLAFLGLYNMEGKPFTVDFLPKIQLEMVVTDEMTDLVVDTIVKSAHQGKIGDGKVFVIPVSRAVRIRTGETDEEALAAEMEESAVG
jgi:nitrogen regulatory protein P-II 1